LSHLVSPSSLLLRVHEITFFPAIELNTCW
jgi:hypothetical protein